MHQADLSISMAGYNTTMNVLTSGVRAMVLPFTGNDDQEQTLRAERLEELGIVRVIRPDDLQPEVFARRVMDCLQQGPGGRSFDFGGVEKTDPPSFSQSKIYSLPPLARGQGGSLKAFPR